MSASPLVPAAFPPFPPLLPGPPGLGGPLALLISVPDRNRGLVVAAASLSLALGDVCGLVCSLVGREGAAGEVKVVTVYVCTNA